MYNGLYSDIKAKSDLKYYTYEGGLTTPTCDEVVNFYIYD